MQPSVGPNFFFVLSFEKSFNAEEGLLWFHQNWTQAFYWIIAYLILVFGGQQWMARRKPFSLQKPLIVWNVCLALFSLLGTMRSITEFYHSLTNYGFEYSVCSNGFIRAPVSSLWTLLFIVSKVPELGDTVFIVLRKQRLIFLHWYHHISVLLFTWCAYGDEASAGRWYIDMNYLVHFIMYSYYALRAMGVKVPKSGAMAITSAQIIQMFLATLVTFYALMVKITGKPCAISMSTIFAGIVMYFSYFVLFAIFFINSYLKTSKKVKKSQ